MTNAPGGTRRFSDTVRCIVDLTVAVRVKQHHITQSVIMVVTIPMMEFDVLIDLDHLPTEGTAPIGANLRDKGLKKL